jgi:quinol monooxygenase YgiN
MILYAEFTAMPGSEADVGRLISGQAEDVRREPGNTEFTVYRERDNPRKFFVFEQYLDETGFEAHIGAEYGMIFNERLGSLIEEGESQLTWLTKFDPTDITSAGAS